MAITKSKEVAVVEKKMYPLVEKALSINEINSESDMQVANDLLSAMKGIAADAEEKKNKILAPAEAIVKEQKAIYKPFEQKYKEGIEYIRGLMGAYQTRKSREAAAAEEAIAARIAPGRGNLSIETGVKKMAEVEKPKAVVASNVGVTKFMDHAKVTIWPLKTIESGYLSEKLLRELISSGLIVWDEVAVRKLVKMQKKSDLPGVLYEIVQIPVNSSNY